MKVFKKNFFSVYLWESMSSRGAEREETQNLKQAPGSELSAQNPMKGSNPLTREIMTWAGSQTLNGLSHPGAQYIMKLFNFL